MSEHADPVQPAEEATQQVPLWFVTIGMHRLTPTEPTVRIQNTLVAKREGQVHYLRALGAYGDALDAVEVVCVYANGVALEAFGPYPRSLADLRHDIDQDARLIQEADVAVGLVALDLRLRRGAPATDVNVLASGNVVG